MIRPLGQTAWDAFAAHVGSSWVADTEHLRWLEERSWGHVSPRATGQIDVPPLAEWAEEEPMSPEEEEQAYWASVDAEPTQGELF